MANPFKPTAGKMPPILVGRQSVVDDFVEGLENGAGAPGRLMLVSGQRGYGKTVMLAELRRVALARGWEVVSETAASGLCERLVEALSPEHLRLQGARIEPSAGVAGLGTASLGGVSFSASELGSLTLRKAIDERLKKAKRGKGVVITVDEAQAASMDDLAALAVAFQHVVADQDMTDAPDDEKRGVALVLAGLPSLVDELVGDKVLTFLCRAQRQYLAEVPLPDTRDAYYEAVQGAGKRIELEVAQRAADAAEGHPYLIQLVGYYMWRAADLRGSDTVSAEDVERGRADALSAYHEAVCAPTYYGLRSPQRLFIEAMASDGGRPSSMRDIALRTGRTPSWASKYRASLIREQVIEPAGHGLVRFAVPHLGDYINERIIWRD
ncbi:MAG TPA: ATP-binding protein [Candidatus Aphodovivens avistercoris]|nr:ATP-binding protein [Candidatus Aphodovivens avistercoris]